MLVYKISPDIEAFSTNISDSTHFEVVLPLHQAHTALVRRVPEEIDDITGVDALITDRKGLRIGVKTADCVPVLVYDPVHSAIAAIHSGWKGTAQNIIRAALTRMSEEFGTVPGDVRAVIGPCIHEEAFEVGDELVDIFRGETRAEDYPYAHRLPHPETGIVKWHIDLPGICRQQLMDCGVIDTSIETRPECTWTMHDSFYSARRLGKDFGSQRILNCIKLL